ncbi:hypothetical protein PH586_18800 [Pseudomonas sp. SA3-5]|uniref:Uncharacterized protein n=1 Tax=Pseudomonas aestuarii TaxID=3018340 RepID=A0ABT4XJN9_9PSED|nr:hypothetical protein [Pseudomonas aestuarii]MDA7088434.1 hypothetical protein [Pseudomonas aestuarii]
MNTTYGSDYEPFVNSSRFAFGYFSYAKTCARIMAARHQIVMGPWYWKRCSDRVTVRVGGLFGFFLFVVIFVQCKKTVARGCWIAKNESASRVQKRATARPLNITILRRLTHVLLRFGKAAG